jgi:hypothetical protein
MKRDPFRTGFWFDMGQYGIPLLGVGLIGLAASGNSWALWGAIVIVIAAIVWIVWMLLRRR